MKFHLMSLGCQMNVSDSERVKTVLTQMGLLETDNENEAQILGVMACSVRQKAIDRVYSIIHKWNKRKLKEPVITFISGCILPTDREKFLKQFDLLFAINELPNLQNMLEQYISSPISSAALHNAQNNVHSDDLQINIVKPAAHFVPKNDTAHISKENSDDLARGFWKYKPSYSSTFSAFVSIQNGCDKLCTFCAVPYTRGREVSRPSAEILQEVYHLMQNGYKSITLLGQNVNSYGFDMDKGELNFAQLLERIGNMAHELKHKCWVYFTSPHPKDMGRDVLEVIAQYDALAKQIHLPLQSGDNKLLMKMNRNHSVEKYNKTIKAVREILPEATLFTDIIVGFCGETHEQFLNTKKMMETHNYAMAYIAMYSPRPGAASSRWEDDIPHEEKKKRFRELTKVLQEHSQKDFEKYLGKKITVLVEGRAKNTKKNVSNVILRTHTEGKIPVYVQANTIKPEIIDNEIIGNFIEVTITRARSLSMEGSFSNF